MSATTAFAGNKGDKVRSDCFVMLELAKSGGIKLELKSKVKSLYGESIAALCIDILKFFGVDHASVSIEDKGALPFVIAARIEAAVKKIVQTEKEYLPEMP